jgi:hypothetical protein
MGCATLLMLYPLLQLFMLLSVQVHSSVSLEEVEQELSKSKQEH